MSEKREDQRMRWRMPSPPVLRVWAIAVTAAASALTIGVLAARLEPPLHSALAVQVAPQADPAMIGHTAEIRPDAGWSVQPVQYGAQLLRSPDRVLSVSASAVDSDTADAVLDSAIAEAGERSPVVLRETLENGVEVRHLTSGGRILAVLDTEAGEVLLRASVADGHALDGYRAAFGELLLRIDPIESPEQP